MSAQLVWSQDALANRFDQLEFIAQDNPLGAIDQDEQIERQTHMLLNHPKLGKPGRRQGTRELVISHTPFIVVYRINGNRIELLRMLHSSQQWP